MNPSRLAATALLVALAGCGSSDPPSAATSSAALPPGAKCVLQSPYLQVGAGLDAPGRLEVDVAPGAQPAGPCRGNTRFRYGAGLYDITGVIANTGGMGWENPFQVFSGLQQRQYARAYALASPCNGKRVLFVSVDVGILWASLRNGVLDAIAADPALAAHYGRDNLMLSATHTHQGPAGYAHEDGGNLFHYGYDADTWKVIVDGILGAIRLAHANLEAHPQSGSIRLAVGELLNTNINRSLPAFALNAEAERREFVNARGEPIDNDKRFVQLNLVRDDGSAVGVINWFGVHATVLGENLPLVSSDIKGYASLGFEKLMGTRYDAPAGADNFVAAFAQTNEGDASPNLFIRERPFPDPTRGGGRDEYESNAISGTKHLAKALELFPRGTALSGPVDYRFFNVQVDEVEVTDPVVLASLHHGAELDANPKRTCTPVLGVSFGGGAEDGPGPGSEGVSCKSSPDVLAAAQADAQVLLDESLAGFPGSWPAYAIPPNLASTAVFCNRDVLPQPGADYSCQAEKPVFLPEGQRVVPFQIFRVGNLAVLGIPWEVTTMSARRIRKALLDVLAPVGIDTVVIAGLANEYEHYLTTREEYSSQQYEGASTLFGPWTLAAVTQEARRLALSLRDGAPAPDGPPTPADATPGVSRPAYVPSDVPGPGGFGAVVTDAPAQAAPGDTVRAEFVAGHPRNDLRTQASYAYVERQDAGGAWSVVETDRDPSLLYVWKPAAPQTVAVDPPATGASTAEIVWTLPRNTPAGTYRLRIAGAAQTAPGSALQPYEGVSREFSVSAPTSACP